MSLAPHPPKPSLFNPTWLFGLLLIGASLAGQGWQLRTLLQPARAQALPAASRPGPALPLAQQARILFGQPAAAPIASSANLDLRLQGCFVRDPAEQSSALIARAGQPARRLRVGAQIQPGVRLLSIQARHVELDVHGQRQRLGLYRQPATPALSTASYP
ncbi:MAG: type II secretion system protein N [Pseudomonas sp.]